MVLLAGMWGVTVFVPGKAGTRLQRRADARKLLIQHAALSWFEAQSRGTTLFTYHEAVDHTDAWSILEKEIDSRTETFH